MIPVHPFGYLLFLLAIVCSVANPRFSNADDAARVKRVDACLVQFLAKGNVGDMAIPTPVEVIRESARHVGPMTTAWRDFSEHPKDHVAFFAYHLAPCRDLIEHVDIEIGGKPAHMTADKQLGRPDSISSITYRFGNTESTGRLLRFGYLGVVVRSKGSERGTVVALRLYCKPFLDSHSEAVHAAEAKRQAAAVSREKKEKPTTGRKRPNPRRGTKPRPR